jgi:ABC-type transport system involved in multi-copper enzyme maturation permease subunit
MSILAIAKDQAGDLLRRRYLIVILIISLGVVLSFIGYLALMKSLLAKAGGPSASAQMSNPVETQAMAEFMFAGLRAALHGLVAFIGVVLAMLLMATSVSSEISKGTARMILSRPVRRYEMFLGKWLGCVAILFLYSVLMGALVSGYTYYAFHKLGAIVPVALGMGFLKAVVMGTTALTLSMLLHPLLSGVIAYFASAEIFLFFSAFGHGIVRQIIRAPFYVLPSYGTFDTYKAVFSGTNLEAADAAYKAGYAVLYSAVMLLIGIALFRKKDLI